MRYAPKKQDFLTRKQLIIDTQQLSIKELSKLSKENHRLFFEILKSAHIEEIFTLLPYEKQISLYIALKEKLKPEIKKDIEQIIRETRKKHAKQDPEGLNEKEEKCVREINEISESNKQNQPYSQGLTTLFAMLKHNSLNK